MSQDGLEDFDRRLRAAEQDAAVARVPAGAADRDVTEMRGKLDATTGGQQHIAGLIQRLIDDQDR